MRQETKRQCSKSNKIERQIRPLRRRGGGSCFSSGAGEAPGKRRMEEALMGKRQHLDTPRERVLQAERPPNAQEEGRDPCI